MTETTPNVQPGDVCFIRSSAWNASDGQATLAKVLRLTAKQIIVEDRHGERRFWKKDLTEVGSTSNAPTGLAAVGAGTVTLVPPSHPDHFKVKAARDRFLRRMRAMRMMEAALKKLDDKDVVDAAVEHLIAWQTYLAQTETQ